MVRDQWLDVITDVADGVSLELRAVTENKVNSIMRDLAGENPSPMELLLIDRIGTCWMAMTLAEMKRSSYYKQTETTFARMKMHDDRCERMQRQFLAAIKALSQVRRLPNMTQVNVYGDGVEVIPGKGV